MANGIEIVSVSSVASSPYKWGYYVRYKSIYKYCESFNQALAVKAESERYLRFLDFEYGPSSFHDEQRNDSIRLFMEFVAKR